MYIKIGTTIQRDTMCQADDRMHISASNTTTVRWKSTPNLSSQCRANDRSVWLWYGDVLGTV